MTIREANKQTKNGILWKSNADKNDDNANDENNDDSSDDDDDQNIESVWLMWRWASNKLADLA